HPHARAPPDGSERSVAHPVGPRPPAVRRLNAPRTPNPSRNPKLEIPTMRTSPPILGALAATIALLGCTSGENKGEAPSGAPGAGAQAGGGAKSPAAAAQEPGRQAAQQQKGATLVQGFVADAKARMDKGDWEGARTSISHAFEIDPSNQEVNALRNAIDAKLGNRSATGADAARQQEDLDRVRRTEARLEVENKQIESKRLKDSGDLAGAIRALQDAELILRWNPYLGGSTESG